MKKLTLLIIATMLATAVWAQISSIDEGFNTAIAPPTDWSMLYANELHPAGNDMTHSTTTPIFEGTHSFRFSSFTSGAPYDEYLITPLLDFEGVDKLLNFRYRGYSSGSEIIRVGVSTTGNEIADFTWGSDTPFSGTTWRLYEDTLTADVTYVAIHYKSTYQYYAYIDKFEIYDIPTCPKPTALTVATTSITAYTANATWIAGNEETAWVVEYKTAAETWEEALSEDVSTTAEVALSGLLANTTYQVRVKAVCAADDESFWATAISFTTLVSCPVPTALAVSATTITSSSAIVTWTAGSTESEWAVAYKTAAATEWTAIVANPTTNTVTLTDLTGGTTYNVRIKAICGTDDESAWTSSATFTTVFTIPYTQDFAGTFVPTGWSRLSGLIGGTLVNYNGGWISYEINALTAKHTKVNMYSTNKFWLVTPAFELPEGAKRFTFDIAVTDFTSANAPSNPTTAGYLDDRFLVIISTDGGATWSESNALQTWANDGTSIFSIPTGAGEPVAIDVTTYTGAVKFAFYGESTLSGGDYDIHIDNVSIELVPDCEYPTELAIAPTSITATGASISWTTESAISNILVSTTAITDFTDVTATASGITSPYTIADLTSNTLYYVYLQADCGTSVSPWTGITFKTLQTPAALPYSPTFVANDGWDLVNGSSINKWFIGSSTTVGDTSVTNGLYVSNNNGSSNAYTLNSTTSVYAFRTVAIPEIGTINISFDWRNNGENGYDFFRAFIVPTEVTFASGNTMGITTTNTPEGWISICNAKSMGGIEYIHENYEIEVAEIGNKNLVFYWRNDGSLGNNPPASIINLSVSMTACSMPTALTVDPASITASEASISWTTESTSANLIVSTVAITDFTDVIPTVSNITTPYTIEDLTANTLYYVYIQANCEGSTSLWIGAPFSTLTAPQIPAELPYEPTFVANDGWDLINGTQTNKWSIGSTTSGSNVVTNGLYISNDNGVSNAYTLDATSYVYAFRTLAIPAAISLDIAFEWRNIGESIYDYLRVFIVPTNIALTAGNNMGIGTTTTPAGWTNVCNYKSVGGTTYHQENIQVNLTEAGNKNLVFYWVNDYSTGANPPVSIINLSVSESAITPPTVVTNAATDITTTTATLHKTVTAGTETITAEGFEYRAAIATEWEISTAGTLTNLVATTPYLFKAFATTTTGTIYGDVLQFSTLSIEAPTVVTEAASDITKSTATLHKTVTAGTETITEEGFEYKTAVATTWSTSTTGLLTGLTAETNYLFKAFATTATGTTYGSELSFTTAIDGIEDLNAEIQVTLYPNPAKEFATVKVQGFTQIITVQVADLIGQIVYTNKINASQNELIIDVSNFVSGTYFVTVNSGDFTNTQKLVILN